MQKRLLYTLPLVGVLLFTGCGQSGQGSGDSEGRPASASEQDPSAAAAASSARASSGAVAVEEAVSSGPTVLFLGDSITAGYGLEPEHAFPALLDARLDSMGIDAVLINAGLSGETSAGGLRRVDWLLQRPVDVLVLELGGNDGLRGVDLQSTRNNLQGIIDQVRAKNPETVLVVAGMMIPPNLGPDYTQSFAAMYPELADSNDAILIPFLLDGIGGVESLMQRDQIHPNEAGHRAVADLVQPYLLQALQAVPARASLEVEEAPSARQIMITDDAGIDGYPPGSPFDIELVREALPGFEVIEARDGSEGDEWTVFHVLEHGEVLLQVDPDPMRTRLGGIRTSSQSVVTDTGHGVGSEFSWIFAEFQPTGCEPGIEEMSGYVVCPAPETESFYYVFQGSWNGPDGELPPLDELGSWKVKTVMWSLF